MVSTVGVESREADVPRLAELDPVSLKRKKSLSLSFRLWSIRMLVELSEAALDQLPIYSANPFPKSGPFGTGKAFRAGWSAAAPGVFVPVQSPVAPRRQLSGTSLIVAACGAVRRSPS